MTLDIMRLNDKEIEAAISTLDGWELVNGRLYREYDFGNFVAGISTLDLELAAKMNKLTGR